MFNQEIFIDDNVIPVGLQNQIQELFEDSFFPWFLCKHKNLTATPNEYQYYKNITNNLFEYTQFTHNFVSDEKINSKFVDLPLILFQTISTAYNFNSKIIRIKANLCPRVTVENVNAHQTPHVDSNHKHWVMIYYVNDSDGDTFLFDPDTVTVKHRISPKKGRIIVFNGNVLHAGMHPRNCDYRMVINFNFIKL